jgi:hypothetical protein
MFYGRLKPEGEHMKRSIPAALGVVIIALAVPAAALATHGQSASVSHHGRSHSLVRHGATGSSGSSGSNSVTSYTGGTLVLALADGDSLTGSVTEGTRFVCIGQDWSGGRGFGHGFGRGGRYNDGRHRGGYGSTGSTGSTGSSGDHGWGGRTGSTGSSGYTAPPPCDSSLLVSGAAISAAQVEITTQGVVFTQIVLAPAVK